MAAGRKGFAAVKEADSVQAQETALEKVATMVVVQFSRSMLRYRRYLYVQDVLLSWMLKMILV
jgi:hypothetical protein